MAFCSKCGAQIPDGTTACPACSRSTMSAAAPVAQGATGGLTDNVAGLLAYLAIPAIIFLVLEPYNKNRFIRFHSFQSLILFGGAIVVQIALSILAAIIPFFIILTIPLHFIVGLGTFILGIILLLKAYQGQMYKLPVIGDIAEKQASVGV